jgi:hypothetical protein
MLVYRHGRQPWFWIWFWIIGTVGNRGSRVREFESSRVREFEISGVRVREFEFEKWVPVPRSDTSVRVCTANGKSDKKDDLGFNVILAGFLEIKRSNFTKKPKMGKRRREGKRFPISHFFYLTISRD